MCTWANRRTIIDNNIQSKKIDDGNQKMNSVSTNSDIFLHRNHNQASKPNNTNNSNTVSEKQNRQKFPSKGKASIISRIPKHSENSFESNVKIHDAQRKIGFHPPHCPGFLKPTWSSRNKQVRFQAGEAATHLAVNPTNLHQRNKSATITASKEIQDTIATDNADNKFSKTKRSEISENKSQPERRSILTDILNSSTTLKKLPKLPNIGERHSSPPIIKQSVSPSPFKHSKPPNISSILSRFDDAANDFFTNTLAGVNIQTHNDQNTHTVLVDPNYTDKKEIEENNPESHSPSPCRRQTNPEVNNCSSFCSTNHNRSNSDECKYLEEVESVQNICILKENLNQTKHNTNFTNTRTRTLSIISTDKTSLSSGINRKSIATTDGNSNRASIIERRSMKLENTYRMDPVRSLAFRWGTIGERTIDKIIYRVMADFIYPKSSHHHDKNSSKSEPGAIATSLAGLITKKLSYLKFPRYRFVSNVTIGQLQGQGMSVASRQLTLRPHDMTFSRTVTGGRGDGQRWVLVVTVWAIYTD